VVSGFDATVEVIDGETDQVLASIPIGTPATPDDCYIAFDCSDFGSFSTNIDINVETNKVYAVNELDGTLVTIDGYTNKVVGAPLKIGRSADFLAVDEKANSIYVGSGIDGTLSVVNGKTARIVGSPIVIGIPSEPAGCSILDCTSIPTFPTEIAMNHLTNRIYVVDQGVSSVIVIDAKKRRKIAETHWK
jgi:DNA-binding beta-propeller fold protein YncE